MERSDLRNINRTVMERGVDCMIEDKLPRVYVAGPFRGNTPWDIECNVRRAEDLGLVVAKMGAVPVIPHTMYRFYESSLPDEFWIEATLSLLHTCQSMVIDLPHERVANSVGTMGEIEDCREHKRSFFYDDVEEDNNLEALRLWIAEQQRAKKIVNSSLYGRGLQVAEESKVRRMPRTLSEILETYERIIIIEAIQTCGGSRTRAAASLGVRRRYLYARISHLGIDLEALRLWIEEQ
jgi:hypothetical protein